MGLRDLSCIDAFMQGGDQPGSDPKRKLLFSPTDDIHGALKCILASAEQSIIVAMFGFDDDELAQILKTKLEAEAIYVQLTLDSSQAGGVHEKAILTEMDYPNSSVAIGRSEHGAIMHLKLGVIDSAIVFRGSTNWSESGETLQDNELSIAMDLEEAGRASARITAIHTWMLGHPPKP